MQRIGDKLHWLREQRKLSLAEAAELLRADSPQQIADIEAGYYSPHYQLIERAAQVYRIPVDYLVWDNIDLIK